MARILLDCAIATALLLPVAVFAQPAPNTPSGVGFKSVADALAALKTRPGAKLSVSQPDGWTIITEQGGSVIWSFTPANHPAHPAVVRRSLLVGEDGLARIEMAVLCQGDKAPCDRLTKDFRDINERSMRALRERMKSADETKQ